MLKSVVYIASVGYSGSTLLDMTLGSNKKIAGLGEAYLLSHYARRDNQCTCGQTVSNCNFWSSVENELQKKYGAHTDLKNFDLASEGISQSIFRKIPSLADIGLVIGNEHLWALLCKISRSPQVFRQAARNSIEIFEIAARIAEAEFIVDSSKYALPLKARYMELKERMKVIFLVRDGRGVCKSLMKRQDLTMEEAAKKWNRFNWNLRLVLKTIPNDQIYLLKYEDFCKDTNKQLALIGNFIGSDEKLAIHPLEKELSHDIGGNPMRFRRAEKEIALDESWKQIITSQELKIFDSNAGKLNRKLGYI